MYAFLKLTEDLKMDSKIIFLGTGGGRIVVANQIASTGGFVIKLAGHQIHVDPGPGALVRSRQFGVKASKTDIIFVSHEHIDHANDLNALIDAITLGGINNKGILIATRSIIEGENSWLQKFYRDKLKEKIIVRPGDDVKIGELNFKITPTQHDIEDCVGFKLTYDNLSIGYTSDTTLFPELVDAFKGTKLLILNVLKPNREHWKSHFCSEDAIKLILDVRPELAVIQHYGAKMLKVNPIYEAREIQRRTGVRTIAAMDGTKINLKP